jgi:GDP-L-fucose synthase
LSVRELAEAIATTVGYRGRIVFDSAKPDGTPRKLLDSGRLKRLGWQSRIGLREGLALAYADFVENHAGGREATCKGSPT